MLVCMLWQPVMQEPTAKNCCFLLLTAAQLLGSHLDHSLLAVLESAVNAQIILLGPCPHVCSFARR